jgi:hypothetical protein
MWFEQGLSMQDKVAQLRKSRPVASSSSLPSSPCDRGEDTNKAVDPNTYVHDRDRGETSTIKDVSTKFIPRELLKKQAKEGRTWSSLHVMKKIRLSKSEDFEGFVGCTPLTANFCDEFKKTYEAYLLQSEGSRSTRSGGGELETDQGREARQYGGTRNFFHAPSSYQLGGYTYMSAAEVGIPLMELLPLDNRAKLFGGNLESMFAHLDYIARLILSAAFTTEGDSLQPMLHGDRQEWYLDHICVMRRATQGRNGKMNAHTDSLFYGHVTVVFNLFGKATVTLKTPKTHKGIALQQEMKVGPKSFYSLHRDARFGSTHEVEIEDEYPRLNLLLRYIILQPETKSNWIRLSKSEQDIRSVAVQEFLAIDPTGVLADRLKHCQKARIEEVEQAETSQTVKLRFPGVTPELVGFKFRRNSEFLYFHWDDEKTRVGKEKKEIYQGMMKMGRVGSVQNPVVGFGSKVTLTQSRSDAYNLAHFFPPIVAGIILGDKSLPYLLVCYSHKKKRLEASFATLISTNSIRFRWEDQESNLNRGSRAQVDTAWKMVALFCDAHAEKKVKVRHGLSVGGVTPPTPQQKPRAGRTGAKRGRKSHIVRKRRPRTAAAPSLQADEGSSSGSDSGGGPSSGTPVPKRKRRTLPSKAGEGSSSGSDSGGGPSSGTTVTKGKRRLPSSQASDEVLKRQRVSPRKVSDTDLELQLKLKTQQNNDLTRKHELEILAQTKDLEMVKRVQEQKDALTALTVQNAVLQERLKAKEEISRMRTEHGKEKDAYNARLVNYAIENKDELKQTLVQQVSHHQSLERDILTRQSGRGDLLYSQTYFSGGTKQISNNPIPFVVDSRKEVRSEGPLQLANFAAYTRTASETAATSSEESSAGQVLVVRSREHDSQQGPPNRALATAENERLKCKRCDAFDHMATHCPEKFSGPVRRGEPDGSSQDALCGRCFQGGHKPSHCQAEKSVPLQLLYNQQSKVQQ